MAEVALVEAARQTATDGRCCNFCGEKDPSADPVVETEKLFWAFPPYVVKGAASSSGSSSGSSKYVPQGL
eukprot:12077505-Heterocapsa_arctica.AAC.1